jgi:hypothetical protein
MSKGWDGKMGKGVHTPDGDALLPLLECLLAPFLHKLPKLLQQSLLSLHKQLLMFMEYRPLDQFLLSSHVKHSKGKRGRERDARACDRKSTRRIG